MPAGNRPNNCLHIQHVQTPNGKERIQSTKSKTKQAKSHEVSFSPRRWHYNLTTGTRRHYDVVLTPMRHHHVASKSIRRHFGVMCLLGPGRQMTSIRCHFNVVCPLGLQGRWGTVTQMTSQQSLSTLSCFQLRLLGLQSPFLSNLYEMCLPTFSFVCFHFH